MKLVAGDWLTCTKILTNQQWGLVGMSVTSLYPTGALISDNQGWYIHWHFSQVIILHFTIYIYKERVKHRSNEMIFV